MSTITTRAGKGSALTHNEVDTNFTNLNTDKMETSRFPNVNGNVTSTDEELSILTGATLAVAELNILDGVTATNAELNKTDDSAAAVANHTSGMRVSLHNNGGSSTLFDVATNVTESTFESVGPTGSSATNIWTAMDSVPASATAVLLMVNAGASSDGADRTTSVFVYGRQTGSSEGTGPINIIAGTQFISDDFATGNSTVYTWAMVPLDSSKRFDVTYLATNDDAVVVTLAYKGYIV